MRIQLKRDNNVSLLFVWEEHISRQVQSWIVASVALKPKNRWWILLYCCFFIVELQQWNSAVSLFYAIKFAWCAQFIFVRCVRAFDATHYSLYIVSQPTLAFISKHATTMNSIELNFYCADELVVQFVVGRFTYEHRLLFSKMTNCSKGKISMICNWVCVFKCISTKTIWLECNIFDCGLHDNLNHCALFKREKMFSFAELFSLFNLLLNAVVLIDHSYTIRRSIVTKTSSISTLWINKCDCYSWRGSAFARFTVSLHTFIYNTRQLEIEWTYCLLAIGLNKMLIVEFFFSIKTSLWKPKIKEKSTEQNIILNSRISLICGRMNEIETRKHNSVGYSYSYHRLE